MGQTPRTILAIAAGAHVVHDGFADVLYVLFPLWAAELGLTLTQVGVLRSLYTAGMALFQIPAGLLAERWGERPLLAAGTAVTACGMLAVTAWGQGFALLLPLLLVAGLGSGVQHPLASALVSKAYETGGRRAALGTYNFAGDVGKILVPAAVALGTTAVGWRLATAGYALAGLLAALAIALLLARARAGGPEPARAATEGLRGGWGIRDARGFRALSAIGMIDTATRTALLTFLPFALIAKGVSVAGIGLALALVFTGGALGKFVCGLVAERLGVIRTVLLTEAGTALGIATVVLAPPAAVMGLLLPLGIALNGTSTVLYGSVADLVAPERRSRAYGLYYSLTVGSSALAPAVYGAVGDLAGVPATLGIVALVVLTTLPLSLALRPVFTSGTPAPASAPRR